VARPGFDKAVNFQSCERRRAAKDKRRLPLDIGLLLV